MKLEVGKKYKTRDGKVVRIICVDCKGTLPAVGLLSLTDGEIIVTYTPDGRERVNSDYLYKHDIVSEVTKVKYLKPLHEVIKDMEWNEEHSRFELLSPTGAVIETLRMDEFPAFGKELDIEKEWLYPKEWIEEREV